jgi:hypothetical protein
MHSNRNIIDTPNSSYLLHTCSVLGSKDKSPLISTVIPASDETDLHALFHILKLPIPISTPWYSRNASLYGPVVPVLAEV